LSDWDYSSSDLTASVHFSHALQPALDALMREFDAACHKAAERAQADTLHRLNQLLRRFRQYQNETEWLQVSLDGALLFAQQVAIFSVEDQIVRLRTQANLDLPANFSFRLPQARAFASSCDLKDPVTALRTPGEVTARLSDSRTGQTAHLFPIMNGGRVAAVLFAAVGMNEGRAPDMNGLELVCGVAGSVLERQANQALHAQITPAPAGTAKAAPPVPKSSPWSDMAYEQRQLHGRAQRFARVTVAEMQLARPEACKAGREQNDLYLFLKREIDKARDNYRKQFMTIPSMVDYLHLELVQTAAEGDEQKMGADYPGQLL
jgi:hypothetical protein